MNDRASTGSRDSTQAERDLRAERILDAAGELLVAWGYKRVTIDDVARRAGVGKGTVYLHFNTKEALFLTVLMRSQAVLAASYVQAMREEPAALLPSRMAERSLRSVMDDPIFRAVMVADSDTLGTLSRSAPKLVGDLVEFRERTVTEYFQVLRQHGIVRTDLSAEAQRHAYFAVVTGFLTFDSLRAGAAGFPDFDTKVDAMVRTVNAAFEADTRPEVLRAAAPRVIDLFQRLVDRVREEIDRQKLT
ncbi:TetR/AcrR family transcriptional regulator [Nocardiopsis gilva YIM 90087]|uniref:TetR/AcrR family transcriptional regulator n=1 Tax=Nocardiopsis gilva YIM 90087 TaxID=1235441 RepID=A0A223SDA8_9ACTN|nr:TetR/AcrR family transcriptional regulator [Nocardiopsis gilva]ASU86144.1 TetR/AcrR family transcriptional regulator [Nocardiopsis gilva YIM 90087]